MPGTMLKLGSEGQIWFVTNGSRGKLFGSAKLQPHNYSSLLPAGGDELQLFREDMTVSVDLSGANLDDEDQGKVVQHFTNQFKQLGLEFVEKNADIRIVMSSKAEKPYEIDTREIGFRRFGIPGRRIRTARVSPNSTATKILVDGVDVWRRYSTTRVDGIIQQKGDESVQEAIDRMTKVTARHFMHTFPFRMSKHPKQGAYAIVQLGPGGIEHEKLAEPSRIREDF